MYRRLSTPVRGSVIEIRLSSRVFSESWVRSIATLAYAANVCRRARSSGLKTR
jgi:hypothetical protein